MESDAEGKGGQVESGVEKGDEVENDAEGNGGEVESEAERKGGEVESDAEGVECDADCKSSMQNRYRR